MDNVRRISRFESEVHLGFIVITSLLLLLNLGSNWVTQRTRADEYRQVSQQLRQAGIAASRSLDGRVPRIVTLDDLAQVREQFQLSDLLIIPSHPENESAEARRFWLTEVATQLPLDRLSAISERLFAGEYNRLTRGEGDEYFFMYLIPSSGRDNLVFISAKSERLAYLDDARSWMIIAQLIAIGLVALVYILLSRSIFTPFRRLRKTAALAGRPVDDSIDETEAVIREYEQLVKELKQNEAELHRLNEQIQGRADSLATLNEALLSISHSGVVTLDTDGKISAINKTAGDLLGLGDQPGEGQSYGEAFSTHPTLSEAVRLALVEEPAHAYSEYQEPGSRSVQGVTISVLHNHTDQPSGLLLMINDLTEISDLRKQLEQNERLISLGEMAGGLAHQLRNSFGAIMGYGSIIKKRLNGAEPSLEPAEALIQETREAGYLVTRFLEFAKPFAIFPEPVAIRTVIADATRQVMARLGTTGAEIDNRIVGDPMVSGDSALLKQAIVNLIDNALQAYEGRPELVEICAQADSEVCRVSVTDYGSGIPEEDQEKILTPFFSSRPSGTGLGLPLVHKIITAHAGQLHLDSTLGKGSCFEVVLPLSRAALISVEPIDSHDKSLG